MATVKASATRPPKVRCQRRELILSNSLRISLSCIFKFKSDNARNLVQQCASEPADERRLKRLVMTLALKPKRAGL
jgi:hypothetical protein